MALAGPLVEKILKQYSTLILKSLHIQDNEPQRFAATVLSCGNNMDPAIRKSGRQRYRYRLQICQRY